MIFQAKQTGKKLLFEETGIAMPISLLAFLFLSFLSMSVFAIGEVIRSRTELQLHVDNAAYAGALVQADTLSRIAVLNRAMVWTYVQINRMQMDYIMNRWLSEAWKTFQSDADFCEDNYRPGVCTKHHLDMNYRTGERRCDNHTTHFKYGNDDLCYGVSSNSPEAIMAQILAVAELKQDLPNHIHGILDQNDKRKDAIALRNVFSSTTENKYILHESVIEHGRNTLSLMNNQIALLRNNMNQRIQSITSELLKNCSAGYVLLCGGKEIGSADDTLQPLKDENECYEKYRRQIGNIDSTSWRNKDWWQQTAGKLEHAYSGSFGLEWTGYFVKWTCDEKNNIHVPEISFLNKRMTSPGSDPMGAIWPSWWNTPINIQPLKLKNSYFGKSGAIVIAAKTPVPNLFTFISQNDGFFSNFNIGWDIWTVSSARAGVRIPAAENAHYENTKFLEEDTWNLFVDDWNAVPLPIRRCWKEWNFADKKFQGESASDVLKAVREKLSPRTPLTDIDEENMDLLH